MTTAGIDFGNSLVKAAWYHKNEFFSATVDYAALPVLEPALRGHDIDRYHLTGIQSPQYARKKVWSRGVVLPGDPIEHEIRLQAQGVKGLLPQGLDSFLLVSMGTATSYTHVENDNIRRYFPGTTSGGGFLTGMKNWFGIEWEDFVKQAAQGKPLSLYFKDRIPKTKGKNLGDFVIADFAKAKSDSPFADICASLVSHVAVQTVGHVMTVQQNQEYAGFDTVVYIGTPVTENKVLRKMLRDGTKMIGLKAKFPQQGEYALAIGALISEEFAKVKSGKR